MLNLTVPIIILLCSIIALHRKTDVYASLITGAAEGLNIIKTMLPSLIALLSAIYMLRTSGLLDALTRLLHPVLKYIGIPSETVSLMLLRPFSGNGAIAVGSEIMQKYGVDSSIGRTAAVMLGSTETTFYVVGIYFGAVGIRNTRHVIPSALVADITSFIVAAITVKLFWK